ncbi:hypothetical protein H0H87_004778 [Tephrocybe sp. NHM501043]|nr:hypothetical protein H0H87_004778 [Tephrocybe sp. NHM501043]
MNISVLTALKGHELGWVCLGSCTADVVINALAIFWVTQGGDNRSVYAGSDGPSKALQDRERRNSAAFPPDVKAPATGRFSVSQLTSFDGSLSNPMPPPSSGQNILRELRDIESDRNRSSRTYKAFKSISESIFSSNRDGQPATESRRLHITVTTQYELEESNVGLDSIQGSEITEANAYYTGNNDDNI